MRKYFLYYRTEPAEGEQKGKQLAQCRICDKIYKRTNGNTNSMKIHLRTHTELCEMYVKAKKQIELKKQQKKAPDGSGYLLFK
jgi:hypothetical protein